MLVEKLADDEQYGVSYKIMTAISMVGVVPTVNIHHIDFCREKICQRRILYECNKVGVSGFGVKTIASVRVTNLIAA